MWRECVRHPALYLCSNDRACCSALLHLCHHVPATAVCAPPVFPVAAIAVEPCPPRRHVSLQGPGIPSGVELDHLGTNVDYAPTWLELAGMDVPTYMDGRSLLAFLLPNASHHALAAATRALLRRQRGAVGSAEDEAAATMLTTPGLFRTETFHQYYNQGPWNPANGGDQCPICTGHGTTRFLDDYSHTYIGLHIIDASLGSGHYKYGEYQNVCSSAQMLGKTCFDNITIHELFDLVADPWELHNVYNTTNADVTKNIASRLRKYYPCQGTACP